jgi:hypothetical protein
LASCLDDFSSKEEEAEFDPKNPRRSKPFFGRESFPLEDKDASFTPKGEGETALGPKNPNESNSEPEKDYKQPWLEKPPTLALR